MGPLGLRGQLRSSEGFRGPTCYVGREEGCKGEPEGRLGFRASGSWVYGWWLNLEFVLLFGNFEGRLPRGPGWQAP